MTKFPEKKNGREAGFFNRFGNTASGGGWGEESMGLY
jgi:hypothetical protein